MAIIKDLTGQRFGRLTVISPAGFSKNRNCLWRCLCDCGNYTTVAGGNLKNNSVKSCGCLRRDRFKTHGLSHSRLHYIWASMRRRCHNVNDKSYRWYGAKGVQICEEWDDYAVFYKWAMDNGYNDGLTIDRIDPDIGYCPSNCRWITQSENARRATQKLLEVDGRSLSRAGWAKELGVNAQTLENWVTKQGEDYAKTRILHLLYPDKYTMVDVERKGKTHREKYLTVNSETMTYAQWAERIGISRSTFSRWMKNKGEQYTVERIQSALAR